MRRVVRVAALLVGLAAAATGVAKDDADAPIDVPRSAPLAAPPRVAALADGRALVVLPYADGFDVVALRPDSRTFGAPSRVVRGEQFHDLFQLGGRRGPRIAARGNVVVVAAATRRTRVEGGFVGGDLWAWRSTDGGATWNSGFQVSDVPGCAAEGLFDLAAIGDGRFVVVWLDCRDKGMRLRADFSKDGETWGGDVLAYESPDGTICECCHPAVSATPDGGAVAAFRNAVKGGRDVWTLRLPRGATQFQDAAKSGTGSWKIAACPMAGPAVAVRGDDLVCAWRREERVFLAVGTRIERDLGKGSEPEVLVRADGVHAFWTVKDALLHLAPGAVSAKEVADAASFPCVARGEGADAPAFVAWLHGAGSARLLVLR